MYRGTVSELRVAILRDPIETSRPGETSHFLAREAIARGHSVWWFAPDDLSWDSPRVIARARRLRYGDGHDAISGPAQELDLGAVDVVLVRHDPPCDLTWLVPLWLLDRLPARVVVANPPRALFTTLDKLLLLDLPEVAPPTLVTRDPVRIREFRAAYGDIVVKPLFDKACAGVVVLRRGEPADAIAQALPAHGPPVMLQRWQPEGADGLVRVMVVGGEVCGALRAVPREGDLLVGLDRSQEVVAHTLDDAQRMTVERTTALLASRGIVFAGLDLVGPWLIEANVTSPGGEIYYDRVWDAPLAPRVWNALEHLVERARA